MTLFEITGLALLVAGGAIVGWIGLRGDPRLIRRSWERPILIAFGFGAALAALARIVGFT